MPETTTRAFLDMSGLETLVTRIKGNFVASQTGYTLMSAVEHLQLSLLVDNTEGYQNASDVSSAIAQAIGGITSIDYAFVEELPEQGEKGTIYFIPDEDNDTQHIEYVWDEAGEQWEEIGRASVDLTGYVRFSDLAAITDDEINALFND
ncbi:MAG: hypothetical protein LBH66_06230 [Oscillospiraceae bacterium]|jgi:hypothetical protein|nr:hypothetical protein [Oscillospiraceae bacterium]